MPKDAKHIRDTLCSRLWKVEILGGGLGRFILTVDTVKDDGSPGQDIVAKIVLPLDAVPDAIIKASTACAVTLVGSVKRMLPASPLH